MKEQRGYEDPCTASHVGQSRPNSEKATSGFEPLFREKPDGADDSLELAPGDVPELNPFLARVLERLKQNEREGSAEGAAGASSDRS